MFKEVLPPVPVPRSCSECDEDISHKRSYAKVCSQSCRYKRKWRLGVQKDCKKRGVEPRPPMPSRDCAICKKPIKKPVTRTQKYCSDECRMVAHNKMSMDDYYIRKEQRLDSQRKYQSSLKALDRMCQTKYGAQPGQYLETYNRQEGKCQGCGEERPLTGTGRFVMDHDHETGRFRGLLCNHCNIAVGYMRDQGAVALNLAAYLNEAGDND